MYLSRVCVICSCCQSRHEWTHLRVGCICLKCTLYVLVTRHEWTHLRVGCICLECALYVLVDNLGMSGPICEWGVSALSVCYMFLLSLGMSGPTCEWDVSALSVRYVFLLCVICSCCDSRHEGTHLRMYCVCLLESVSS